MKNKKFILATAIIASTLFLFSCGNSNEDEHVQTIENSQNVETEKISKSSSKFFPTPNYLESISTSLLKFSCTSYKNGRWESSWASHCCLYANNSGKSYLALPTHCFRYDSKKEYEGYVTDQNGRKIRLLFLYVSQSLEYDAEILVVKKIENVPTLCNREMITIDQPIVEDSALLLCPFNPRNVYKKSATFLGKNQVKLNFLFSEPGDSGALIIGRNGVVGIEISVENNGGIANFVPMAIFEDLYASAVLCKDIK